MGKQQPEASDLINFKNSQGLKAKGTLLKLSQNYIVFEVYNPYSIVQLSETLSELIITRAGKEIYNGTAIVANIVNTGIILIVSAIISDNYWKSTVDVNSKEEIQEEINHLIANSEHQQIVDVELKMNVIAIRSFLSDLADWLEKLEPSFIKSKIKLDEKFILDHFSSLFKKLTELFRQSSDLVIQIKDEQFNACKKFIHGHLHHFIMSSPFAYRAYSKPLGFAGDYMMMNMIQKDSAEGSSLYAKFINVFYAYIPLSRSVNNRTKRLIELITEGVKRAEAEKRDFHSLSIGCGPALEVKKFIEANNPKVKCHFHLLDFNQETLDFARSKAEKVIGNKQCVILTKLDSVHSLLKKA